MRPSVGSRTAACGLGSSCARVTPTPPADETRLKDGQAWRIGAENEVAWIDDGVKGGMSITAAIPPIFAAYTTLVFPKP